MNASRTFFLFAHGAEERGTISMTARMLGKLCEARRLKALEDKPLIDRATERVRNQAAVPPRPRGTQAGALHRLRPRRTIVPLLDDRERRDMARSDSSAHRA